MTIRALRANLSVALEAVAAGSEIVVTRHHAEPEARALGLLDPETEQVLML